MANESTRATTAPDTEWSFDGGKTWTTDATIPTDKAGTITVMARSLEPAGTLIECPAWPPSPSTGGEPATDSAGRDARALLNFAADVIELFDDKTMEGDYMLDAGECAGIIRALPDYLAAREPAPRLQDRFTATGRKLTDDEKAEVARVNAKYPDREPAPVARELDVEAERRAVLDAVAVWYAEEGYFMDEDDIPAAIRALTLHGRQATAESEPASKPPP